MAKFTFLLGAAAGYVLGARAGRPRYEQIKGGARQLWQSQAVQQQVSQAKHTARTKAAPAALDVVSSAAAVAGDKMRQSATRISSDAARDVPGETIEVEPDVVSDPQKWAGEGGRVYPLGEGGETDSPQAATPDQM